MKLNMSATGEVADLIKNERKFIKSQSSGEISRRNPNNPIQTLSGPEEPEPIGSVSDSFPIVRLARPNESQSAKPSSSRPVAWKIGSASVVSSTGDTVERERRLSIGMGSPQVARQARTPHKLTMTIQSARFPSMFDEEELNLADMKSSKEDSDATERSKTWRKSIPSKGSSALKHTKSLEELAEEKAIETSEQQNPKPSSESEINLLKHVETNNNTNNNNSNNDNNEINNNNHIADGVCEKEEPKAKEPLTPPNLNRETDSDIVDAKKTDGSESKLRESGDSKTKEPQIQEPLKEPVAEETSKQDDNLDEDIDEDEDNFVSPGEDAKELLADQIKRYTLERIKEEEELDITRENNKTLHIQYRQIKIETDELQRSNVELIRKLRDYKDPSIDKVLDQMEKLKKLSGNSSETVSTRAIRGETQCVRREEASKTGWISIHFKTNTTAWVKKYSSLYKQSALIKYAETSTSNQIQGTIDISSAQHLKLINTDLPMGTIGISILNGDNSTITSLASDSEAEIREWGSHLLACIFNAHISRGLQKVINPATELKTVGDRKGSRDIRNMDAFILANSNGNCKKMGRQASLTVRDIEMLVKTVREETKALEEDREQEISPPTSPREEEEPTSPRKQKGIDKLKRWTSKDRSTSFNKLKSKAVKKS